MKRLQQQKQQRQQFPAVVKSRRVAKVLVVGDSGVGKTSIIKRYSSRVWSPGYRSTIGADCLNLTFHYTDDTDLVIQLWDVGGQERFKTLTRQFYRHALAAIVVYDVSNLESLNDTHEWKREIEESLKRPSPALLVGNKADLLQNGSCATVSETMRFCEAHDFCSALQVSARDGTNIDRCMDEVVSMCKRQIEVVRMGNAGSPDTRSHGLIEFVPYQQLEEARRKKKFPCTIL